MNYRTMVKGALALSLSLMVGSASAATTTTTNQVYGATFESEASLVAPLNDFNYALNSGITNAAYRNTSGVNNYGWFSGAPDQDESKIVARTDAAGGQALQLNTDASTLTNMFSPSVASDLNTGIATAGAFFETEVKFVPSDTLDAGITGNSDATKFAIYAYAAENNNTTNLVVYHGVMDTTTGNIWYTNEVFDVDIDASVYTTLHVEMKTITDPGEDPDDTSDDEAYNVFSVKVGNTALSSTTAYADGKWFLTVEQRSVVANRAVSSLNFKGTGEIDNIKAGTLTTTTTYTVDWTDSDKVVVSNATEQLTGPTATVAPGTTLTFFPTEGTITNINGVAQDPGLASWPLTVNSDTNVIVLAGAAATPPAGDDYAAGDEVGDVASISAGMATWLNGLKTAKNMTKAQLEAAFAQDQDIYTLTEEYLLNTDPTVTTTVDFSISSIAIDGTVDLQVTLTRTEGNEAVTAAINGDLKILGATSLDGQFDAGTAVSGATFNNDTTEETSLTTNNKFFKAVIVENSA